MKGPYRVFEVTPVDDVAIQEALNKGYAEGYALDRIKLVAQEGIKRPVLAYVIMFKAQEMDVSGEDGVGFIDEGASLGAPVAADVGAEGAS